MQSSSNSSQACGSCPPTSPPCRAAYGSWGQPLEYNGSCPPMPPPCPSRPATYVPPNEKKKNEKKNRKR